MRLFRQRPRSVEQLFTPDTDLRGRQQYFERVLCAAAQDRDTRRDLVDGGDGRRELGWVVHERRVMLAAVNEARAASGLAPVGEGPVRAAEALAVGHVDFVAKWALGCARLTYPDGHMLAPARTWQPPPIEQEDTQ